MFYVLHDQPFLIILEMVKDSARNAWAMLLTFSGSAVILILQIFNTSILVHQPFFHEMNN